MTEYTDLSRAVVTSPGAKRLLAFVALHGQPVARLLVAGILWSEAPSGVPTRPSAPCPRGSTPSAARRSTWALGCRLLDPGAAPSPADLSPAAIDVLSQDLLPGWYDDWVVSGPRRGRAPAARRKEF